MNYVEIPQFPVLSGDKAIEALETYVRELQTERGKELTEKQFKTMMKFTLALISAIEMQTHPSQVPSGVAQTNRLMEQLHEISRKMFP